MTIFTSILLGFIQGLTEFLPISSSGHLVLIQELIPDFKQPGILFDVVLHFGTLAAVLYFFRSGLLKLSLRYLIFLFVGTLPAVILGFFFREQFEGMFAKASYLGTQFIITGVINFLIDKESAKRSVLNIKNSLIIGLAQAVAIIPAISRSGMTIFAATRVGINKKEAAEFSFLLSVPAILGANLLEILSHYKEGFEVDYLNYLLGFASAFIFGLLSIGLLMKLLLKNRFKYFGYYALALGFVVLLYFKKG